MSGDGTWHKLFITIFYSISLNLFNSSLFIGTLKKRKNKEFREISFLICSTGKFACLKSVILFSNPIISCEKFRGRRSPSIQAQQKQSCSSHQNWWSEKVNFCCYWLNVGGHIFYFSRFLGKRLLAEDGNSSPASISFAVSGPTTKAMFNKYPTRGRHPTYFPFCSNPRNLAIR